jgi:hypothetical protein
MISADFFDIAFLLDPSHNTTGSLCSHPRGDIRQPIQFRTRDQKAYLNGIP